MTRLAARIGWNRSVSALLLSLVFVVSHAALLAIGVSSPFGPVSLSAAEPRDDKLREEESPGDDPVSDPIADLQDAVKQHLANGRFRQALEAQQALVEKLVVSLGAEDGRVRYDKAYLESIGRMAALEGDKAHAAKDAMTGCYTALRLRDRGDLVGARRKSRRACAILATLMEKGDMIRTDALYTLGVIEHQIGNLRAARAHFVSAVEGTSKAVGNDHHEYAIAVANLGKVELDLGYLRDAKQHLDEARQIWSAEATQDTSRLVTTWYNLSVLESARGDYVAAEAGARAGIAAARGDLENAGSSYSLCRLELISSLLDQEKYREAARDCREAVEELEAGDALFPLTAAATLYEYQGFALRSLNELDTAAQSEAKADLLRQGLQEESGE